MAKKDTKYVSVNSMLQAAGKTMFINFYYDFKDPSLSDKYLCEKVYRESPTAKSPNQRYKVPRARQIFQTNQQIEALNIVINSTKLPSDVIEKAKIILAAELAIAKVNEDTLFENEFNNDLLKEDIETPFEYNNKKESPREKSKTSNYTYPRSKKVTTNALKKAKFLCEVDSNHKVFLRKKLNINYTEPHHLIPLSAQEDFPDANLDREQNVVSLCSHCHNLLHYGAEYEKILKPLFEQRKELLEKIGIIITYDKLKKYYE